MFLHHTFQFVPADTGREVELVVKRVKLEKIPMRLAWRGTWSAMDQLRPVKSSGQTNRFQAAELGSGD
jgi:hypothetical protein